MKLGAAAILALGLAVHANAQAPVILGDQKVFEIKWAYGPATTETRAAGVSDRLKRIARNPLINPSITVTEAELSTDLVAGDTVIFSVFDGDARAENMSRQQLAPNLAQAMEQSIYRYREQHHWRNVLLRWSTAILILALSLFLFITSITTFHSVKNALTLRVQRRLARADHRWRRLLPNDAITTVVIRLLSLFRAATILALFYASIHAVLLVFPGTRAHAWQVLESLLDSIKTFGSAVWRDLPGLIFVALVGYITYQLVRLVRYIFRKIGDGEISLEGFRPQWAGTTSRLVSIFVVLLGVLIAYPYIPGSESNAFKGISIFIGLLVSLGSSGLVSNLMSGIMLTYMDEFDTGDYVTIGEVSGFIDSATILTTRIRTRTNRIVIIPNSVVLGAKVTNYAKLAQTGVGVTSTVGVGYDVPWRQVEAMLKLAAARTGGIRTSPAPYVLETSLNQFDITYELAAYLEAGEILVLVQAELNRNILDAFNEYGVQIMTPAYQSDPNRVVVVPKDRWYSAPAGAPERFQTEPAMNPS